MDQIRHKVSIIVPVYNVEEYIEESIISICKQEFDDYQIILVNDGTKDNSVAVAESILKENKADYVVWNQINKGLPSARNVGLREADGKYVVFIDSDDIVTSDFLSSLYQACEKYKCKAAFTEYEITHRKNRYGINNVEKGIKVLNRDELLYNNMLRSVKIHLCAMMVEREFLLEHDLWFNEDLRYGEEVDFTWRMYPLLDCAVHIESKKYKYLVRENSLMQNQNSDRVIFLLNTMHNSIGQWFEMSRSDSIKYRWVEHKIYFEKMHAFAQQSTYDLFKDLLAKTNYRIHMRALKDFPDRKIRLLAFMMNFFPFGFWTLFRVLNVRILRR